MNFKLGYAQVFRCSISVNLAYETIVLNVVLQVSYAYLSEKV